MPLKWNDTTERMVLLKALEQNPTIKLDGSAAVASWPAELGKATKRSIEDRFNLLKRQIREVVVPATNGLTSTLSPAVSAPTSAQQSAPATPSVHVNKKVKTNNAGIRRNQVVASPNPISTASGSSKPGFTNRLLNKSRSGVNAAKPPTNTQPKGKGNKRKRDDESESSMSSEDSDAAENKSNNEALESPSTGRRSLPRRSKSVSATPCKYNEDSSDHDGSETNESATGDASDDPQPKNKAKGKATARKRSQLNTDSGDASDDSTYDNHRDQKSRRTRDDTDSDAEAPKQSWRKRIERVEREMREQRDEEASAEIEEASDEDGEDTAGDEDGESDMGTQA